MDTTSPPLLGSVLIFGGCGFLGHHIAKAALHSPDATSVAVVDIDTSKNRIPGIEYITGSIKSTSDVALAFKTTQPTVVFHIVSPDPFSTKKNAVFQAVNVDGTKLVIAAAQECETTKALIYTSSSSIIHDDRSDMIMATEDARVIFAPEQPEFYSHTKALAERLVLAANGDRVRTAAIRPAGLFGEGDMGTVTSVISNAREGKGRLQIGDNSNLFDWTYVENNAYAQLLTARALVRSYDAPLLSKNLRVDGEAFVITNDDPWNLWTFTRALAAAAGYPIAEKDVVAVPGRAMMTIAWVLEWAFWIFTAGRREPRLTRARVKYTTMVRTCDISKAKERLEYRPQIDMQEGIRRSAKWFLESHA
ncbi:C-3 sterol dehydrogenase/C-4 decarboxylase [Lentithecium fluviatile CBS 122367]|uniref:C-3 sterol dehydrogenase/C-4 decarboxylase n=1 Tax=Lentithecium fluviatile CBS 122367 TaxID=1168545 RepID=A0A6G1IN01_9PLEO|nr:C-3 sterol dehydrogenase/C-4 decarboxylase [Lentithecium fluviatile CBS 122367]